MNERKALNTLKHPILNSLV